MNVLITGASQGIGYELALQAVGRGHDVMAVSRNAEHLEELAAKCLSAHPAGGKIVVHPFDLTKLGDVPGRLMEAVTNEFGQLDMLVNNAGTLVKKGFEEISDEELLQCLNVNFMAPFRLTACCMPLLRKAERPHVINIGSMAGFQGSTKFPGLSAYSASKAALSCLTESLAREFKDGTVRFNCLSLGSVETRMLDKAFPGLKAPVTAVEMAAFILDFAVTGYDYFNGRVLPVARLTP